MESEKAKEVNLNTDSCCSGTESTSTEETSCCEEDKTKQRFNSDEIEGISCCY